jgi:hypothetical protein
MLRKITVVVAIAVALGGSALPTSAFARSAFAADRVATAPKVGGSNRVLHGGERDYGWQEPVRRGYERDPWGHWGAYYGPMI